MITGRKTRVVLGMSGGVDSSAAAAVLLEQGYDVIGVTLKLWPQDCLSRAEDKCCGPQAVADARGVCDRLGIPFYLVDEAEEFQLRVVEPFAQEYRVGRTPNPCVLCNEHLKFGTLLRRAQQLGAEYVATGHYARLERTPAGLVDGDGRVLGHHDGIEFFTIGQRRGLGVSAARPLYVIELDPEHNRVVVGEAAELQCEEFLVVRANWIPWDTPPRPLVATAQIRYQHRGTRARVTPLDGHRARVELDEPQRAVTPGQACVFYEGDRVLGGGWIQSASPAPRWSEVNNAPGKGQTYALGLRQ